ncbi:hypothetical protein CYLTODRAFT_409825 [Cylindrobasidium torrendii FP15055 ss-10]|uniref:Uncharacterized protein n=1 Tax=Cylindrobasidium torrendii FP15055 ss-10 TaxID=1314674 RepID=A0A0D7BF46_9AGAR|nr:hypothetical protein CYLTODRAFT_409825 [Cylindrobasidium torrendii FP15055 ss-10]
MLTLAAYTDTRKLGLRMDGDMHDKIAAFRHASTTEIHAKERCRPPIDVCTQHRINGHFRVCKGAAEPWGWRAVQEDAFDGRGLVSEEVQVERKQVVTTANNTSTAHSRSLHHTTDAELSKSDRDGSEVLSILRDATQHIQTLTRQSQPVPFEILVPPYIPSFEFGHLSMQKQQFPTKARKITPTYSLDELALRAANNDYSAQGFKKVYRPSLVFQHNIEHGIYHREPNASMNAWDGQEYRWDTRAYFELVVPRRTPAPAPSAVLQDEVDGSGVEDSIFPLVDIGEEEVGNAPSHHRSLRRFSSFLTSIALSVLRRRRSGMLRPASSSNSSLDDDNTMA